jgi:predicted enzyme related to lactoylglutathione lyase
MLARHLAFAILSAAMVIPVMASADPGRVTGFGGIFFKSKDPKALAGWYRDVLGIALEGWGGAALRYDAAGHPPVVVWGPFPENTDYFAPSAKDFMVNFAVDDMDAFLARIEAKGVKVLKRDDTDPSGKFAWIVDPDGTTIELWPPK